MRRAFTLIELLVVISIVALLSSVVLGSLNAAREKARINAARQFEAQVGRLAGEAAVGIWDFDECSLASTTPDRSGFGNHGTMSGAISFSADTPSGQGCSIALASGRYVSVPFNQIPVGAAPRTISIWIKPSSIVSGENNFIEWGTNGAASIFGIYVNSGVGNWGMHFGGTDYHSSVPVATGKWSHLVLTYTGSTARLYLDGNLIRSASAALATGSTNFFFGRHVQGSGYVDASLDSVRVYGKTLTASEVRGIYASEKASFELAGI